MIVAVVADTHLPRGSRRLPAECVRRLAAADLILHAGDHSSVVALEELRALGPPVEAVHGNVDEPGLRAALPGSLVLEREGVRIGMTHDAGPHASREQRLVTRFPGCAAIVYGHTHLPQVARHEGVWILNPGSPTERRRAPGRGMLVLRLEAGVLEPELVTLST